MIAPLWPFMGVVMVMAAMVAAASGAGRLSPWPVLLLGLAAGLCILSRMASRRIRGLGFDAAATLLIPAGFVGVPCLLFGIGMAWLVRDGVLSWIAAVSATAAVAALGAGMQAGNRNLLVGVQMMCWLPLAAGAEDPVPFALAAASLMAGLGIARYQHGRELDAIARADAAERVTRRAEEILTDFEETGQGWFWETDRDGKLTYVSETVGRTLHSDMVDLLGQSFSDLFDPDEQAQDSERTLAGRMAARSSFSGLVVRSALGGRGVEAEGWWSISGRPVQDEFGAFCGFRGSGHDLTETRRSQQKASRLAHYDSLTGLANRLQMSRTLERILTAPPAAGRDCAVFLLDLDRFKQVNDTQGHLAGDSLLQEVAQRLEHVVGCIGSVGRLGGDEFEIIVPGRMPQENLAQLAQRMIETISQPYSIDGHKVVIGASLGIAVAPEHGATSETLIRNADLALYAAKDGGRGAYRFFGEDLHSQAEERRLLENDLRLAIGSGGLDLHYQPVIHTATEKIAGFEALLRWNHPRHGFLSPARFIEVAEEAGLIIQIGEWILGKACEDLAGWPESIRVAVNVSPLQFANPELPRIVERAIANAGIRPDRLELEITESVFLSDNPDTDTMFAVLKKVGVRLALDDFGTGYSALTYLKRAPFDKIKIDQSFVRGATQRGSCNGAIIASITSLAQALGMDTTAEGVETLEELEMVRLHGCSHVQGYIYAKPLTAAAATDRLGSGPVVIADGPRAAREPRRAMLCKVVLDHQGELYNGVIRNVSADGALIEGLWNVPPGTTFRIAISENLEVIATTRWSQEDRMGVEFAVPLNHDQRGDIIAMAAVVPDPTGWQLRHAG